MAYAIISLGGKQYRVQEGERLFVDRVKTDEGETLTPDVLFFGDGAKTELSPKGVTVTARVVGHVRGEKIRIGKYRRRTGYRRHTGFRAALSELEIEKIGARGAAKSEAPKKKEEERVPGMPKGYEEMTVAQVAEGGIALAPSAARGGARLRARPRRSEGADRGTRVRARCEGGALMAHKKVSGPRGTAAIRTRRCWA